jgi:ATP-dependent DNA ligase
MSAKKEPIEPMEARSAGRVPVGPQWLYEPKWDGFRCLIKREGKIVSMRSKSGQALARYFPEVVRAALSLSERHFMLDGELVIKIGKHFSFDTLLQRIHPAATRIARLTTETPATFMAFDLLKRGRRSFLSDPLPFRRAALEDFAARCFAQTLFELSPSSSRVSDAKRWLGSPGNGRDGVIAKRTDLPYQAGNRNGMEKIKPRRTADCVVGGFRYNERPAGAGRKLVGSLLLGLYDGEGLLHHVGFTSALAAKDKPALTERLEAMVASQSFTGNAPGGPSRWSTKRSAEWCAVRPKLVVEVSYDHFSEGRFRHGTSIERWRPDKKPKQCTMVQLAQKKGSSLRSET